MGHAKDTNIQVSIIQNLLQQPTFVKHACTHTNRIRFAAHTTEELTQKYLCRAELHTSAADVQWCTILTCQNHPDNRFLAYGLMLEISKSIK